MPSSALKVSVFTARASDLNPVICKTDQSSEALFFFSQKDPPHKCDGSFPERQQDESRCLAHKITLSLLLPVPQLSQVPHPQERLRHF